MLWVDCDTVIEAPGGPIDPANCDMPCTGNQAEDCGGAGAIEIFQKYVCFTGSLNLKALMDCFVYPVPLSLLRLLLPASRK